MKGKCNSPHSPRKRCSRPIMLAMVLSVLEFLGVRSAPAQGYASLYSFQCAPNDGTNPSSGMVLDSRGNLYGTTIVGGAHDDGTVFELSSTGAEVVLHSFAGAPSDGNEPNDNGRLAIDSAGHLFGSTVLGGEYDLGTLFELTATGREKILHSFTGHDFDGSWPYSGLIQDSAGNIYGTTSEGGQGYGTVFEFNSSGETVLYSFGSALQGRTPVSSLALGHAGNLYGTTLQGGFLNGGFGSGVIYKLSSGEEETVLHQFGRGTDGASPNGGLVLTPSGSLYGTTSAGGVAGYGTVFAISAAGQEHILHSFTGSPDGASPFAGLVQDTKGNLYGAAFYGGSDVCYDGNMYGCGVLFKVTPAGQESILYTFGGVPDGANPWGDLLLDSSGNLYGTTYNGGAYGCGTVFEYTQ